MSCLTTARARIELIKSLHKLTRNGYLPLYTDTDSIMVVKVDLKAPPLEEVVPISLKIGDFKIEKSEIETYVGLQAKLYSYVSSNMLHCRAKGFSAIREILEKNDKLNYFEEELEQFFLLQGENKGQKFLQPRMEVKNYKIKDLPEDVFELCLRGDL